MIAFSKKQLSARSCFNMLPLSVEHRAYTWVGFPTEATFTSLPSPVAQKDKDQEKGVWPPMVQ